MGSREPLPAIPPEIRFDINMELQEAQLAMLDDNARFIVRRMVGRAYVRGFDAGWRAGQGDAQADRRIALDAESRIVP